MATPLGMDKVTCCSLPHLILLWTWGMNPAVSTASSWTLACLHRQSSVQLSYWVCLRQELVRWIDDPLLQQAYRTETHYLREGSERSEANNCMRGARSLRLWCYWCTADSEHEDGDRRSPNCLLSWLDFGLWKESSNGIVCERLKRGKWSYKKCFPVRYSKLKS